MIFPLSLTFYSVFCFLFALNSIQYQQANAMIRKRKLKEEPHQESDKFPSKRILSDTKRSDKCKSVSFSNLDSMEKVFNCMFCNTKTLKHVLVTKFWKYFRINLKKYIFFGQIQIVLILCANFLQYFLHFFLSICRRKY